MATSYNRLSFSNDEEFKLIEFIKNHPALWDASHTEYGNAELRKLYWVKLSKELNKSVFECRRKWRFVRDYYIHKRRRQPESTPQRDGKYYSLQFLNKIKVSSKKNASEMCQKSNVKSRKNIAKAQESIEVDYIGSDEEIDYNFLDDPTIERITVERMGNSVKNNDEDVSLQHQDPEPDANNEHDDRSDDFLFKEDYIDEENTNEVEKLQNNIHEIEAEAVIEEEEDEEHFDAKNLNMTFEQGTDGSTQTDSKSVALLHDKAIDLFFESMAAAVKTFPPQYVAEAKCKVFMAFNEVESKVYRNTNKN
ncbi:uncharacterized protein LOC129951474 [Eupeodes corollae]|uniref:uncharacterized protein LOC129951474 n=1 Tax=Eupeodes corollae TaxID=290404 RepID=UPI00249380F0|nr:uncharacterized protein LOC129951474 [Eupeodes corollae]